MGDIDHPLRGGVCEFRRFHDGRVCGLLVRGLGVGVGRMGVVLVKVRWMGLSLGCCDAKCPTVISQSDDPVIWLGKWVYLYCTGALLNEELQSLESLIIVTAPVIVIEEP